MSYPLDRFYNVNRIYLSLIGLWPYQEKKTKLIRIFCVQVTMLCCCISHFTKLISMDLDLDTLLKILPFSFISLCVMTCYYGTLFNVKLIKVTWDQIEYDWNELMTTQEINVLEQYASAGKLYTIILLVMFNIVKVFGIMQTILPVILDVVIPLNESRPLSTLIPLELIFDQEKYFFPTLLCLGLVVCHVEIITVAVYGLFMVYVQHACGMFRLVWYTLDTAFDKTDRMLYTAKEDKQVYKNIVRSIKIHRRAIEFTGYINSIYGRAYLIQATISCFVVGINVIQVCKIKFSEREVADLMICLMQIISSLIFGFFTNYMCQNVIDHSLTIFDQAYETPWYLLLSKTRRLLLLLMMNSSKPYYITIGYIFISCNEFYAAFLQTTLSYAMVIYNLQ